MSKNPLLTASELSELIVRTKRIGADQSLVVFGGGNTSVKGEVTVDGQTKRVMWIKASGGDMATATAQTFAPLDLDILEKLKSYDDLTDEQMVEMVGRSIMLPGAPRPSIETLLHGFMPFKHIDHIHSDAICALTNHPKGREATMEALGEEWAYVDWIRSGFPLSKIVEKLGDYRGVVLAHHGVITWAETSEDCLKETLAVVNKANAYLEAKSVAPKLRRIDKVEPAEVVPRVRGQLSRTTHKVVHLDERFLDIVNREDLREVVSAGVSSADHMLRIRPFSVVLDDLSREGIGLTFDNYSAAYDEYTARNMSLLPVGYDLLDSIPRVALIPGLGAITSGSSLAEAKMVAEIAFHTHKVACQVIDSFGAGEPMPDSEIFRFEYWPMELYKLSLKPAPKKFSARIFIVTGAASGIGLGVSRHLASLGASLVLADLNEEKLTEVRSQIESDYGIDAFAVPGDQSDPEVVANTVAAAVSRFGGLDGIVANAGIAVTDSLADLELARWKRALEVNLDSAFLLTKNAIRLMENQAMGGSLVFNASKNAFAPGAGFGAYSVTKAGMIQLMRIAAIEGGASGIRSNAVNPDAIFDNSALWSDGIRQERAASHGVKPDDLEDFYASRNLLKLHVRSDDVARAIEFLLSEDSSRTTGSVIPVDGGVVGGFPR
jgi:rhamnulose-1-phosphate aldolase/alcohol dehydrogenase|tara:strand:+ start:2030 stop:4015 length:1986 start_codon:yes stop_codon:yes gene_type:complete